MYVFFTDNEAVVQVINKQTCGANIMALLRPLVLACLRFYINFDYGISARCKIGISKKNAIITGNKLLIQFRFPETGKYVTYSVVSHNRALVADYHTLI